MKWVAVLTATLLLGVGGCADSSSKSANTPAERFAGKLEVCDWPGVPDDVWCGTLDVPEGRSVEGGRAIGLRVAVLPATGDSVPQADAVTFLPLQGTPPTTARTMQRLWQPPPPGSGGSRPAGPSER